ncbi:hypothetical protein OX283_014480 [Flavobacterium sp. SUN052]|uniref:hypothetical protein n=1 Tax=Flavobacterium sp. SUN052 TaxID=3002441 RepID=UPI00237ECA2A|nr:hypothetical protein [Flavobacterium sp. SUN052]MEC4005873.1 hypothetical protein [Flavobacterium sp. SUN052]
MELQPNQVDIKLAAFHNSWNLERIQKMTLEEYADLNDHDSLCYWLEYGTDELGLIGGVSLHKFEIWKPKNPEKELKDKRYSIQEGYFWNAKKGTTRDEAFNNIKELIVQIVKHPTNLNWEALDNINYHAIAKWKLAFIFSNKSILPIYSKRALLAIAKGLGDKDFPYKTPISVLQKFIIKFKPEEEEIEYFAGRNYVAYAEKKKPNFYIIGSKYGDENGNDIIPKIGEFIDNNCVAVGFLDWLDFSLFMGATEQDVMQFVFDNWKEEKPAVYKLQTIFRKLTKIKEGDIIAVKSHGAHNQLTIIAYAEVVKRDGKIYEYHPDLLGHHINVQFLDAGFSKLVGLTYAETIHELNKKKDGDKFDKVFGWYSGIQNGSIELEEYDEDEDFENEYAEETGFAYNEKSEESFNRNAISSVKVNLTHNIIQNSFIKFLKNNYPNENVKGERNRIDALRETASEVHIYEIKPYENVFTCIREGIGQLLDYSHQYKTTKEIKIYIVGPNEPNQKDLKFIDAIRDNLKIPFCYISYNHSSKILNKF